MDTHTVVVPDSVRSDRSESTAFLVLGGDLPMPPGVPGVCFQATPSTGCAGIIILGPIAPAKLAEALDEMPEPALPIADFADNRELRRDFIGERLDPSSIQAFRDHSTPIWRRLSELPVRAAREDRAELNILRLAYSRDVSIEASFAPDSMLLVDYQLLGRGSATRQQLEALADMDLLRRRFFTRSHACGHCGSARLHAYEACSACGRGNLFDEAIVHHYRCGWQGPESGFADHRLLVCPKCRRELRHFGVDYGKPGIVVSCRECGAAGDEPVAKFVCLDCAAITPTADCVPTDWSHYDLTEEGIRALRDGRLPRLSIAPVLEGHRRAFSLNEFRLLTAEGMRISARYGRPFAVGRLSVSNIGALRREIGPVAVNAAFRLAIEVSVGSLRESDFVAADGAESMVIGFPETSARDASNVLARVKKKVAAVIAAPLELVVSAADGDAAATLVDQD
jgi:GGDEF domain-containing protein